LRNEDRVLVIELGERYQRVSVPGTTHLLSRSVGDSGTVPFADSFDFGVESRTRFVALAAR
jgi:hypothetical protein